MPRPEPARIAVVGAGWWSANHHVPSLATYPGADLVALCDRDRERAEQLAREHGVPTVLTDVAEVVRLRPDGVIVATPHDTHHEIAGALLDAGIPVLVEKPLTTTGRDATDLVRRAEVAGVPLAVGYTDQYTRTSADVRRAVQEEIGELVQVLGEFTSATAGLFARAEEEEGTGDAGPEGAAPADQHAGSYGAAHGGGQAHTQLTHLLGMICWVTGRQVERVAAFTHDRGLEVDVDDVAALAFRGGGTGVVSSTGLGGQAGGERHHVRYLGTRGTVDQDMLGDTAVLRRRDGAVEELGDTGAQGTPREPGDPRAPDDCRVRRTWLPARAFADLVRGVGPNPAPGHAAAAAAAATEAVLRSAATGTVVRLPDLLTDLS